MNFLGCANCRFTTAYFFFLSSFKAKNHVLFSEIGCVLVDLELRLHNDDDVGQAHYNKKGGSPSGMIYDDGENNGYVRENAIGRL